MAKLRTALGLMSGTSLDGIDVALLRTDGDRVASFGPTRTFAYSDEDRALLRSALLAAVPIQARTDRPPVLAEAELRVGHRHAEAVRRFVSETATPLENIDAIGFHGQTVLHDPSRRLTVQIGDGRWLANALGRPVVWDFRAADVAAGGQGAPLVPVFHAALATTAGLEPPVAFVNIGGVANVTYVGPGGELLAFDTGPGNALLDDWTRAATGAAFDSNGDLAAAGTPSLPHLDRWLQDPFFALPPPKSLDRASFSPTGISGLSAADGAATLTHFTARSIAAALQHFPSVPRAWYVCGGGRRNLEMMRVLGRMLATSPVSPVEQLGFDGDATEAQAFAFLAVRAMDGRPLTFPTTTGVAHPVSGGVFSVPGADAA